MGSNDTAQDTALDLFGSSTILPAQYYSTLTHRGSLEGERKLMFAVLEDAIQCYLKNMDAKTGRRRILFFEVRDWMKREGNTGPFSFELLCHEFGMESARVRNTLEGRRALARAHQRAIAAADQTNLSLHAKSAASTDPRLSINSTQSGPRVGNWSAAV